MNEIVRKIVPVSSLPPELQNDFDPEGRVEIVGRPDPGRTPSSLIDIIETYRRTRTHPSRFRDGDDVVAYVRALRDGGDLEPWLGPCSTSTPTS
ncbi:hypothetical protein [uncultured Enterovirga sp.]|uniref:hypothetical protein n=1 Tax=uncultured Enterovirga sp. TaxID=2026352 RepID=UPI0035CB7679